MAEYKINKRPKDDITIDEFAEETINKLDKKGFNGEKFMELLTTKMGASDEKKDDDTPIKGVDYAELWVGDKNMEIIKRPAVIQYPARYIQGANILSNIGRYLQILPSKNPAILISEGRKKVYESELIKSFETYSMKPIWLTFGGEVTFEEINQHMATLRNMNIDSLISIGGGKCIDAGKVISFELNIKFISFPTIASNDAPCSALSIIYNTNHSYKCGVSLRSNPDCVCVDESIIVSAPCRYFAAGVGDAMATYYEAKTCYDNDNAINMLSTNITESALCLAKLCCDILHQHAYEAIQSIKNDQKITKEVSKVIEANINLSGVGFESGGLALAHAVAQGLSASSYIEENYMHGEMVSIGTIVHLFIENNYNEMIKCAKLFKSIDLPMCINDIGFNKNNVKDFDQQFENILDTIMSPQQWFRDNMKIKIKRKMVRNAIIGCNKITNIIHTVEDVKANMEQLY